jgi:RNA polymerase sigma factor (sigma-70 family)
MIWSEEDTDDGRLAAVQHFLRIARDGGARHSVLRESCELFAQFYDPVVRRFAHKCHVSDAELDDFVQDVWAKVWRSLPELDHDGKPGSFRRWLFAVVHNHAIDSARRRKQHPIQSLNVTDDYVRDPVDPRPPVQDAIDHHWPQSLLRQGLEELERTVPERNYRILYLRLIEERSVEEVAREFDLKPKYVRAICCRTRQELIAIVKNYTDTEAEVTE